MSVSVQFTEMLDALDAWTSAHFEVSSAAFDRMYKRMGLTIDFTLGESFYRDKVGRVYKELTECGIAEEDQGALVVFLREHERFKKQPFIIRKSDGASNYASTDLATLIYRVEQLGAQEIVYVTDGRQQDHFQQLFLTVDKWFKAKGYKKPIKVAVMGCVVNGPGEAREADIGIAGGKDEALLFIRGEKIRMLRGDIVGQLVDEIYKL